MKINKEKFKIDVFVAVSLIAFSVFGIALIVLKPLAKIGEINQPLKIDQGRYFLNKNYSDSDPMITKNPGLKEMLAGPILSANDPALGDKFAPVTIVYFSDFECEFCHKQEQIFKKIAQNYPSKIRLIWKDYPETDQESWSYQAALSARCAQAQGQFWAYHDFLFELKGTNNSEKFFKAAELVKLNMKEFRSCLEGKDGEKSVQDNIEEANALEINGVPFVYVNDKGLMGEVSYEELEALVKEEISK